jgi:hypothetical protein
VCQLAILGVRQSPAPAAAVGRDLHPAAFFELRQIDATTFMSAISSASDDFPLR